MKSMQSFISLPPHSTPFIPVSQLKCTEKHSHIWLFEWVAFGRSAVEIFTPTLLISFSCFFFFGIFSNAIYSVSGLVRKRGESWPQQHSPSAHTELFHVMI
ncbi:hypothetical protein ILYODFUR_012794 [Ilyodon furcidens]|uniref:Uncharacterized protein n=1 Tax=Ilyodon furcidens TaxID=33524 RepID=A0ABV0TIC0_9TELE